MPAFTIAASTSKLSPEAAVTVCLSTTQGASAPVPVPGTARTLSAWKVRALATLCTTPPDPMTMIQMQGYDFGMLTRANSGPHCLVKAARLVLKLAERARARRWAGSDPLHSREVFHACEDHEHTPGQVGPAYTLAATGWLVSAHDALVAPSQRKCHDEASSTPPRPAVAHNCDVYRAAVGTGERLADFVMRATAAQSVAPSVEADLMTQGYTATELVLDLAAEWVLDLARVYATATGTDGNEAHASAREAVTLAAAARQVLAQGVRHTLGGRPLDFATGNDGMTA